MTSLWIINDLYVSLIIFFVKHLVQFASLRLLKMRMFFKRLHYILFAVILVLIFILKRYLDEFVFRLDYFEFVVSKMFVNNKISNSVLKCNENIAFVTEFSEPILAFDFLHILNNKALYVEILEIVRQQLTFRLYFHFTV